MASRFLKAHSEEAAHGRLYLWSERCFDALLRAYEIGLDLVLRWRLTTLLVFFATVALSGYLFVVIPKGFFPQQDTGLITSITEAGQDVSFVQMTRIQEEIGSIVQADPDVASVAMAIGGGGNALNNGRMYITLTPRDERKANAQQIIARLRPQFDKVVARGFSCRRRRTSGWAVARRARSSNIPCRTPISMSSIAGRQRSCRR